MFACCPDCFSIMSRRQRRDRGRLSPRGRDEGLIGERLSPTPFAPEAPEERLSPPLTPDFGHADSWDRVVSDSEPANPPSPDGMPPPPPVTARTLMYWAKPTEQDLYLHKLSYGKQLEAQKTWPLRNIFDEIYRLHMDNADICSKPLSQPFISPVLPRQYYMRYKGEGKGSGKGKDGWVCIPYREDEICTTSRDRFKVVCDDPHCPSHKDEWSVGKVLENKRHRLHYNLCRIAILMAYAKYSTENMPC